MALALLTGVQLADVRELVRDGAAGSLPWNHYSRDWSKTWSSFPKR
jgi:hypothetical protein